MTFLKKLKTLDADFLRFYKEVKLENAAPFFPNFKLVLFETLRTNLQQHKNLILLECLWKGNLGFAAVTLKIQTINRLL